MDTAENEQQLHKNFIEHAVLVGNKLSHIELELHHTNNRVDVIESNFLAQQRALSEYKNVVNNVKDSLVEAEDQRKEFNKHMSREVKEVKDTVKTLVSRDDERHKELVEHISNLSTNINQLAKETAANSNYISEAEIREGQEKYAEEQIKKVLAPRIKLWNHVKMTAAGLITLATLTALGKLAWMAVNIDDLINKARVEEQVKANNGN